MNREIGRILHLKAEIPKSQIGQHCRKSDLSSSNFGFEMREAQAR